MPMNPDRLPKVKEDPDRQDGPASLLESLFEQYREAYLNAKWKGELPLRVFFNQASSKSMRAGKGRYGRGVYTLGKVVDRNVDDTPDSPHSTDLELLLNDKSLMEKYGTTEFSKVMGKAKQDGYVGFQYGDDKYFLFEDTVMAESVPDKKVDTSMSTGSLDVQRAGNQITVNNTLTGETNIIYKNKNGWNIEGQEKSYRNPKTAINALGSDMDILNIGQSQGA